MLASDLDFDLPPELIAQEPAADRDASRLLHYTRSDRAVHHRQFRDLPELLRAGDLMVFNDARVIPARFWLRKNTGGLVEALYLREISARTWRVLLRNAGAAESFTFAADPAIQASSRRLHGYDGEHELLVETDEPAAALLRRVGRMPLPPYIRRDKLADARDEQDRARYQTVFADAPGSVAAPTAGLHFTDELLRRLEARGIERTAVTLHVGMGTFKPITADKLADHVMHAEEYSITPAAAGAINSTRRAGRRIVAVGTTSARVLESQPPDVPVAPGSRSTDIFIRPPHQWRRVGALITNFHLPRSTLIALVAAMVGLDEQRRLYRLAIEQRYRFFSYGDATLIE